MKIALDVAVLTGILFACWHGYQQRQIWLCIIPALLLRTGRHQPLWLLFCIYAPVLMGWLLLCHWVNAQGWRATSAGLLAFAMVVGLEAMRQAEERQKRS